MKFLALDIGNVLVNLDMAPFKKALSKQVNISGRDANDFIDRIQVQQDLGLTTLHKELRLQFNIKSEYIIEDLMEAWNAVVKPNYFSIDFLNNLVDEHDIKVVLVSNLGFDHMNYFNIALKDVSLYKNSIHHFSCEIGARKPTALYYKLLLDAHPEFAECVYVDDLLENLEMGKYMGFNSFHFDLSKYKPGVETMDNLWRLRELILKNQ